MRSFLPLIVVGVLLFAGAALAQNLLQNGSFESPDVAGGTAQVFPDGGVPGWTDTSDPECGIEIQDNCCGSPSAGAQHVEVDSNCPSLVTQTVATQPGASYLLSFDFSPRPGLPFGESNVDVSWNGTVIFTADGVAVGDTDWTHHTAVVTATGTSSSIEFAESPLFANPTDSVGGYIDNVPEPARSAQLAAGLSLLAGLALLRRRTPRSQPRGGSR
jgi:hypothetical protein